MGFIIRIIRALFYNFYIFFKYQFIRVKWIIKNRHNRTRMGCFFPTDLVTVGNNTYGKLIVHHFLSKGEFLSIGNYCCIGPNVEFFLGGEHHPQFISNYPFGLKINKCERIAEKDRSTKGRIVVGDDVWIGANTIILSGVTIGQGAIIGAGSCVARDIPPYAIFAGGRIVKYRFANDVIDKLCLVDYGKIDAQFVYDNLDLFYSEDIEAILDRNILPIKETS